MPDPAHPNMPDPDRMPLWWAIVLTALATLTASAVTLLIIDAVR